jgi:class 3 adenylate cyclase
MTVVCPACEFANPEGARFCAGCGKPLDAPVPVREVRKIVTVVFCDVTGSTALGERIDPESLRHVIGALFRGDAHGDRAALEEAERLARGAVAFVEPTDYLEVTADAYLALGAVLGRADKQEEAQAAWRRALELYEQKGVVPRVAEARGHLAV